MKKSLLMAGIASLFLSFSPKQITWVALGDSITYLNDHPDETGNRVSKGYMTRVAEKLPGIKYINQGHNGWTSQGIAEKVDELGIPTADVYSVFLGTNDWWQGRPVGTISDYKNNSGNNTVYGSFRIIINKLRSLNPSAKIILITPMQRGDFVYLYNFDNNAWGSYKSKNGQQLSQVADAVIAIGAFEHFDVADVYNKSGINLYNMVHFKRLKDPETGLYKDYTYPAYTTIPFDTKKDEYPYPPEAVDMTFDGLHPSDKGNEAIAKMLVGLIKKTGTKK